MSTRPAGTVRSPSASVTVRGNPLTETRYSAANAVGSNAPVVSANDNTTGASWPEPTSSDAYATARLVAGSAIVSSSAGSSLAIAPARIVYTLTVRPPSGA